MYRIKRLYRLVFFFKKKHARSRNQDNSLNSAKEHKWHHCKTQMFYVCMFTTVSTVDTRLLKEQLNCTTDCGHSGMHF